MGWFFKRSARFGPFRLNFSKSGIGVSAGVRGARIWTGPRGTYVNLGTNGIYYRQKIGGYPATPRAERTTSFVNNSILLHATSLPTHLNYPVFPKHGLPRIVTTLGLLGVFSLLLLPCILVFAGWRIDTSGLREAPRTDDSKVGPPKNIGTPSQSKKELGFQAGFDYALRTRDANRGKKVEQGRVKQIAAQMAAKEREGQEWQQGWIEGYTRGSDKSIFERQ